MLLPTCRIVYTEENYWERLSGVDYIIDTLGEKEFAHELSILKEGGILLSLRTAPNKSYAKKNAFPLFKQILFSLAGLKYDRMAKHQGKEYRVLFLRADGMQLEKITHIVETTKIVPQINSTWALPIKIVNAKKLLQVFAIFLNAFSILIGSGYSWFRCRFIAFGNARAPLLSLAHLLAMYLI